jgi:hypothetical protein
MQPDSGSTDYIETDFDHIPQEKDAIERYEGEDIVTNGYLQYHGEKTWIEDEERDLSTWKLYPDPDPDLETEAVFVIEYWDEITDIVPKEAKERTAVNDDIYGEELRIAGELDAWAEDSGGLFEEPSGWQPVIMTERAFPVDQ